VSGRISNVILTSEELYDRLDENRIYRKIKRNGKGGRWAPGTGSSVPGEEMSIIS
jgi:hypothetical protein